MTPTDRQITRYLQQQPGVRNSTVARLFGVEPSHIATLRRRADIFTPRDRAARDRGIKRADLDDRILAAVYKRGLVDEVLQDKGQP